MNEVPKRGRISSIVASALIGSALIVVGLALLRVELTIRTKGQVRSEEETRIYAPMDGLIAHHRAELGQSVARGDVLLELDDQALVLRVIELEREAAELDAALAAQTVKLRELDLQPASLDMLAADGRVERLSRIRAIQEQIEKSYASGQDQQIISELEVRRQEIEKLRSELELAQAELLSDLRAAGLPDLERERIGIERQRLEALRGLVRREIDLVRAQQEALKLRAPIDGQVVALSVRYPGMAVARGAELLKLAPTSGAHVVKALVPERNIDLLKIGTPALMESHVFESMLEGAVRGTVERVAPEAQADGYEIDIRVEHTPHPLVLGSSLDVRLNLGHRSLAEVVFRSARDLRRDAGRNDR